MRLSLSTLLFADAQQPATLPLREFCALAKDAGYDGVELREAQIRPEATPEERKQVLRCVRDAGLVVTGLVARDLPPPGGEREDLFSRYLQLCQVLECRLLRISGGPIWLHEAAKRASPCGVILATSNLVESLLETVAGASAFMQAVNHPNMGLLYDPLHFRMCGQDYLAGVLELAQYTRSIQMHSVRSAHATDLPESEFIRRNGRRWIRALPDEPGAPDWTGVFRRFRECGYDGLVTVVETGWPAADRERVARHCATAVRRLWDPPKVVKAPKPPAPPKPDKPAKPRGRKRAAE